jgi:hypothetical protein
MRGDTAVEVGACDINSWYAREGNRNEEGEDEGSKEEENSGIEVAGHDCNNG